MWFADLSEASREGLVSGFGLSFLNEVKTIHLDFNNSTASADLLDRMLRELLAAQCEEQLELELAVGKRFVQNLGALGPPAVVARSAAVRPEESRAHMIVLRRRRRRRGRAK